MSICMIMPLIQATSVGTSELTEGKVVYQGETPINVSTYNVTSADFWDALDTPADISTGDLTDDNTFVEIAGDNMTGPLGVHSINEAEDTTGIIDYSKNGGDALCDSSARHRLWTNLVVEGAQYVDFGWDAC